MALKEHLTISDDGGGLFDTRVADWHTRPPLRAGYRFAFSTIDSVAKLKATLRHGPYAWPGGYVCFFITDDGATLSFESVRAELRSVIDSIQNKISDGWRVVACECSANVDDADSLICEHSNKPIA